MVKISYFRHIKTQRAGAEFPSNTLRKTFSTISENNSIDNLIDKDSKFLAAYINIFQKYLLDSFDDYILDKVARIAFKLSAYNQQDIIKNLLDQCEITLMKISKDLDLYPRDAFLALHEVVMNRVTLCDNTKEPLTFDTLTNGRYHTLDQKLIQFKQYLQHHLYDKENN